MEEDIIASIENDGKKPAIAITMGDPCGIGPEVVVKAMADPRVYETCRPLVVGNVYAMEQAVSLTGATMTVKEVTDPTQSGMEPGVIDVVDIHNLTPQAVSYTHLRPHET